MKRPSAGLSVFLFGRKQGNPTKIKTYNEPELTGALSCLESSCTPTVGFTQIMGSGTEGKTVSQDPIIDHTITESGLAHIAVDGRYSCTNSALKGQSFVVKKNGVRDVSLYRHYATMWGVLNNTQRCQYFVADLDLEPYGGITLRVNKGDVITFFTGAWPLYYMYDTILTELPGGVWGLGTRNRHEGKLTSVRDSSKLQRDKKAFSKLRGSI